ncbi:type II toxin-antitoxin system RatA family toxin [Bacteriovorax sp. Seq25_V]|uniref:type II toxin-antitoxin system RatA family toxin n=1 Tax=Bacteriovorax sp. Seq25_V TaxID=1201288 RepID=UPI00038A2A9B|nr:SRPBCC family protein [Bacteriovorax sp. Seq25_V]EQC44246.1 polyketide cyclase/dehydrase [Bacteriovorax sp. Seq25_V]
MAKAQRTEVFEIDIQKFYNVIIDYKSYPDFVLGVNSIEVLEQDDNGARVKYSIDMIKKLTYILNLKHKAPNSVSWTFESGDLFKINQGGWELKDLGNGKTEVTYSIELDIKGFIPGSGMIVNKLTETSLPSMMKSYFERAKSL